jgi:hypothetical protein
MRERKERREGKREDREGLAENDAEDESKAYE